MNHEKYRKWILCENWRDNEFNMKIYEVENMEEQNTQSLNDLKKNHPFVLSNGGFWISYNRLCIGYEMSKNPEIFRPIFSQKRQRLIDKLNFEIIRRPYFFELCKIKKIPIACVKIIVLFIL